MCFAATKLILLIEINEITNKYIRIEFLILRSYISNFDDFFVQDPDSLSNTAFQLHCVQMCH